MKQVSDPQRFGVAYFRKDGTIKNIVEKPKKPATNWAVTGFYLYDNRVFDIIKNLKPSTRGEYEITDVNNFYMNILKPLMIKYNLTIIMLHHSKKDTPGVHALDSLRGSSDFINFCDSVILFSASKHKYGGQNLRFNIRNGNTGKILISDSGLPQDSKVGDIIKIERKEENKTNIYFRVVV